MNSVRTSVLRTLIVCLCAVGAVVMTLSVILAPQQAEAAAAEKTRTAPGVAGPIAAGIPENDDCENASDIGEESVQFTTIDATTDGFDVIGVCFDSGFPQITSDIWYCYTPSTDGIATAATCSAADYDTKIAIYDGCGCPADDAIACDDDDCIQVLLSTVNFQVFADGEYLIRLGGFPSLDNEGSGELVVSLIETPCGVSGSGLCDEESPTPGCEDAGCCNSVCTADTFCCETEWDDICVEEADGLCFDGFTACGVFDSGDCFSSNGSPGCEDPACCQAVCEEDTVCCITSWDERCGAIADTTAECNCGPEQGDCFTAHAESGCQEPSCCTLVCAFDNSCCTDEWTPTCALVADGLCEGGVGWAACMPPGDGDCFDPDNGTPGCDRQACCEAVCDNDKFCCVTDWDEMCSTAAEENFCRQKGDFDLDNDVDADDYDQFEICRDENGNPSGSDPCTVFDFDDNGVINVTDWGGFQVAYTGTIG